jgi:hypothetical protein
MLTTTPGTVVVPLTTQRGTRVMGAPAALQVLNGPRLKLTIWLVFMQVPALQIWLLVQGLKQPPQWMLLLLVLAQVPLQQVSPGQQAAPPDAHVAVPTAPQTGVFVGLGLGLTRGDGLGLTRGDGLGLTRGDGLGLTRGDGLGLTRGDGLGLGLGLGDRMGLAGMAVQPRAVHVWSGLQALLHAPQWLLSLVVLTHAAGQATACRKSNSTLVQLSVTSTQRHTAAVYMPVLLP